ncbi:Thioredoxin domain-containing protein [Plasmodiophora brassicae]
MGDRTSSALYHVVCDTPDEFDARLRVAQDEARRRGVPLFILAFGQRDPDTGRSWCPDCHAAYPVIIGAMEALAPSACLLEITVERAAYKGNPAYAYRRHSALQLKAIPQLYRIQDGDAHPWLETLVENDCLDAGRVEKFVLLSPRIDLDAYDTVLLDCDGVLWTGPRIMPGAVRVVNELRRRGKRVYFVSNNSMSSREQYVAKLAAMGIPAVVDDVLCTSFAAARYLKDRNHSGKVYVVGNEGIGIELRNVGIEPVEGRLLHGHNVPRPQMDAVVVDREITAVVVGFDPELTYAKVAYATWLLHNNPSVQFICTNRDATFPSAVRVYPGAGSCVAAIAAGSQREPVDLGKPTTFMLDLLAERLGGLDRKRCLMIGDNLFTDIAFGHNAGTSTVLVLSGVSRLDQVGQPGTATPHYILRCINDLL